MNQGTVGRAGANGLVRLAVYLAASLIVGGLLTVPVYVALGDAGDTQLDSVLRRVVTVTAFLLLPLYLAGAARDRDAVGFGCSRRAFLSAFCAGLALGVLAVMPLASAFVLLGIRVPAPSVADTLPQLSAAAAYALVAAAIVGLVEEAYFRGALMAPLRALPASAAIAVIAVVYSAVHFVGGPAAGDETAWYSGLASIRRSEFRIDALLALAAAGMLLGAMRYRAGHVGLGAGFHAGWVWLMKLNQDYTDANAASDLAWLAGSHGGTMGYLGLVWITLLGAAWLLRSRLRAGGSPAGTRPAAPPARRAAPRRPSRPSADR
ncbi:MAG: CPBP family intramembrane metalloprotease [Gammaproteobacteria bacterium]|nr:CPBP family intramembrane metalloprotease [Gammaproteobacteria bacterium]